MASPYFGNTLTDLQRGRTASEEIASRIAIQKLIQETAAQEAAARRQEQGRNYDLQRQQLAQQGAYQQGMLGNQMRSIDSDALTRQAQTLFDQTKFNEMLKLKQDELAASMFTPRATEAAAEINAQSKANLFAQEQNARAIAEQNLADLMGQNAQATMGLKELDSLEASIPQQRTKWQNFWSALPFTDNPKPVDATALFNRLPKQFQNSTNTLPVNIEAARRMFQSQTNSLGPLIDASTANGIGTFVRPLGNGMFTNTLPMTATSTNAAQVIAPKRTDAQRAFILEQARRTKLLPGVNPAAVDAEVRRLLGD